MCNIKYNVVFDDTLLIIQFQDKFQNGAKIIVQKCRVLQSLQEC